MHINYNRVVRRVSVCPINKRGYRKLDFVTLVALLI